VLSGVFLASPGQASVPAGQAPAASTLFTLAKGTPPSVPHRYVPSIFAVDTGAEALTMLQPGLSLPALLSLAVAVPSSPLHTEPSLVPGQVYVKRSISVAGSQATFLTLMSVKGLRPQSSMTCTTGFRLS